MNLVWFRNDLRVDDNPALFNACIKSNHSVMGVYFICEKQMKLHGVGFNHKTLILNAISNLQIQLEKLNIELLVVKSTTYRKSIDQLVDICRIFSVENIYFNKEYAIDENKRDQKIQYQLKGKINFLSYFGDQLIEPDNLLNQMGFPYKVFTPFSKALKDCLIDDISCYSSPKKRNKENAENIAKQKQSLAEYQIKTVKISPPESTLTISINGAVGSKRIKGHDIQIPDVREVSLFNQLINFSQHKISDYQNQRDFPANEFTSQLSSGLSVGAISVKRCYQTSKNFGLTESVSWRKQLIWRDFYRYIIWHFPKISRGRAFDALDEHLSWSLNENTFSKWKNAQTGVPIIDAAINQLLNTGWMHNRLRMIVASYLCKNLWLNWRLGEAFFAQHLFDYDFANNNGGWQWCASIGTDAAPYFRVFNPAIQQKKFDPEAQFIKKWLPQLADFSAKQIHAFTNKKLPGYYDIQTDLKDSRTQAVENFKRAKTFMLI